MTSGKELFNYRFEPVGACIMCGSDSSRVLGRRLDRHQGLRPRHRKAVATTVVQCGECRLIYADPRPVSERIAEHYDTPPEDYWVAAYFDEDPGYFQLQARSFDRLWRGSGTPRALDVGAGIGKAMDVLARHGFDAHGLEPSRSFYDRAISRGIPADHLRLATVEDVDYERETFDLVTFGAVLEHLQDPAVAIERALGWLSPGGLIHAEVPSARWLMARLLNLVYRLQGLDCVTNLSPMHPPYHLYEFTPASFRRHGERVGYELVEYQLFVCQTFLPRPLDAVATSRHGRQRDRDAVGGLARAADSSGAAGTVMAVS